MMTIAFSLLFLEFFQLHILGLNLTLEFKNRVMEHRNLVWLLDNLLLLTDVIVLLLGNRPKHGDLLLLFVPELLGSASHVMPLFDCEKILSHSEIMLEIAIIHVLLQRQRLVQLVLATGHVVGDVLGLCQMCVSLLLLAVNLFDNVMHLRWHMSIGFYLSNIFHLVDIWVF